jgi:hypothetical protein
VLSPVVAASLGVERWESVGAYGGIAAG